MSVVTKRTRDDKTISDEEEHIIGSFSSSPVQGGAASYHVFVTDKRVMGIRIRSGNSIPAVARDLDSSGTVDFSIPRGAISRVTMRSAGKNRNVFVIQIRGGRALKILLKHATEKDLQKEKDVFIDGFQR
jgi:hypothetical protein